MTYRRQELTRRLQRTTARLSLAAGLTRAERDLAAVVIAAIDDLVAELRAAADARRTP